MILKPQPGPQEMFLATMADIAIYGGAAGGGKSYGLLLTPLRYKNVPGFNCTIFRKNYKQIFAQGGLWDEAGKMYRGIRGADSLITSATWRFRDSGGNILSRVSFAHIERDEDAFSWQGSQLCLIGYDELTHFSSNVFFYMLSRNRSTCGVKPFVRATCNPDADSWVADFISWWIDPDSGYPIPERSGKIRWMLRINDSIIWADTKEEAIVTAVSQGFTLEEAMEMPKSVTFIASTIDDNQILLQANPGYKANLKALPTVERERLLLGNWKIRPAAGLFFGREQVEIVRALPSDVITWVRCWDLAASEKDEKHDPAYTAGVLMGKRKNGRYIVADVVNRQLSAGNVRKLILATAQMDREKYGRVRIRLPQDPGQAGKEQAQSYIRFLAGFDVTARLESGSKVARAEPISAQWQAGNFDILSAPWNEEYMLQMENFPDGKYKDMVDASANAFTEIELKAPLNLKALI